MKEENSFLTDIEPGEALGACLQWACSPRGGNNFYGRVLNGCARRKTPGIKTCGVRIAADGRYELCWDPEWFVAIPDPFRLMAVVHEAAHLMLRHIERALRFHQDIVDPIRAAKLREVINVAMDMAANDISVRPLVDDQRMRFRDYRHLIIWPEDKEYPRGRTFEEYLLMLLRDLKQHGWTPEDSDSEMPEQSDSASDPQDSGQQGEEEGDGSGGGSGEGDEEQEGQGGGGSGSGQQGKQQGQGQGSGDQQDSNTKPLPQWFKDLLKKKHRSVRWDEVADNKTNGEVRRILDRAKREAKKITRQAVQQTEKSRGTVPGGMQSIIDDLLGEPVIPWQVVLRGMLRSQLSQKLDESTAYPNTALINDDMYEPYPGFQNNFTFRILAAFDTSGSMSEDDFRDSCVELRGLLETEDGVEVDLIQFDYGIQHQEELTSDDVTEFRSSYSRYGHGGTSFSEPLRYARFEDTDDDWTSDAERPTNQRAPFDLMLIFTDGYAPIPLPDLDPKIPLIWVLTEDHQKHDLMKMVLHMKA